MIVVRQRTRLCRPPAEHLIHANILSWPGRTGQQFPNLSCCQTGRLDDPPRADNNNTAIQQIRQERVMIKQIIGGKLAGLGFCNRRIEAAVRARGGGRPPQRASTRLVGPGGIEGVRATQLLLRLRLMPEPLKQQRPIVPVGGLPAIEHDRPLHSAQTLPGRDQSRSGQPPPSPRARNRLRRRRFRTRAVVLPRRPATRLARAGSARPRQPAPPGAPSAATTPASGQPERDPPRGSGDRSWTSSESGQSGASNAMTPRASPVRSRAGRGSDARPVSGRPPRHLRKGAGQP